LGARRGAWDIPAIAVGGCFGFRSQSLNLCGNLIFQVIVLLLPRRLIEPLRGVAFSDRAQLLCRALASRADKH
jgi:hypothetical protein